MRARQISVQLSLEARSDPARMEGLRKKFLETAMSYMGTPYARRYHSPDCMCVTFNNPGHLVGFKIVYKLLFYTISMQLVPMIILDVLIKQ